MGKKQKRTIFLLLGALLVVAAAIAVLLLLPEKEEGGQDGPSVVLTDRPVDEVASLAVENEKGSYQFIQVTTGPWAKIRSTSAQRPRPRSAPPKR